MSLCPRAGIRGTTPSFRQKAQTFQYIGRLARNPPSSRNSSGLCEGEKRVSWRREAKLSVVLQPSPLRE